MTYKEFEPLIAALVVIAILVIPCIMAMKEKSKIMKQEQEKYIDENAAKEIDADSSAELMDQISFISGG